MALAKHPRASLFVRQNLFACLTTFAELEQRIAGLPDKKSRGDAFEVFAEAYLATQRKHDAAQVWPLSAVPAEVLKNLSLDANDYGVDGVFQTLLGHYSAYQVKFRTGRQSLTWTELSKFIGLADNPRISGRALITNCDDVSKILKDRQGFFCVRGSDLERLEADDFRAIESWLANSVFTKEKKHPKPHQIEALDALLPALREYDRVSAIMACGTGKTLVALWAAEHMQAGKILVLLPSLALLRQTLHEWLHESTLASLAYLCVCSDPTVTQDADALATHQSDLDFQVSTDAKIVRDFLDAPFAGTKIIFSTYQSARVIGEGIKNGDFFDFGVFDEAHKTAGREGRNFALALDDAHIPIRKRLFLTATPRHYNPHKRDDADEAELVFSMDNPEVYGSQAYRMTFAEAARQGIICRYKVVISIITTDVVTNDLLKRGEVMINGDAVRAKQVANQIALRDAVEKYGVKKVFTFHRTVQSAASFVAEGNEGVQAQLPNFKTLHVSGAMPTAHRERVMREFRAASRAVVSNARCLTEGVDVPAVDMVAFLSPRRSRVDIVQAIGRAMRRAPGKTVGYVLVPVYVELSTNESVEEAVSRADFDEIWDILQSLQEQDDVLAELIRHVGEQKGRVKGFDDSAFADHIDFSGPCLSLETLRIAVASRCLENICSSWDTWLGRLKVFKEQFGHCNVPRSHQEKSLFNWVWTQRQRRKKGQLTEKQINVLENLGIHWDRDEMWAEKFEELQKFIMAHGHCEVAFVNGKDDELADWIISQRNKNKKGQLRADRKAILDATSGFTWDTVTFNLKWQEMYNRLKKYHAVHGDTRVPQHWKEDPKLAGWVLSQRTRLKSGDLNHEQIQLLKALGFDAIIHKRGTWEETCQLLVKFKEIHGHCDVPSSDPNKKLVRFVNSMRTQKNGGRLAPDRIEKLNGIGFPWAAKRFDHPMEGLHGINSAWKMRFDELLCYKQIHGNCDVPSDWTENPKLGRWVSQQRQFKANGKLHPERERMLSEIDFVWRKHRKLNG